MTEQGPIENSIRHSITKSGFPEKAVRLPFKPVYQACKKYETNLTAVLEHLKEEGIFGSLEGDFIVFHNVKHPKGGQGTEPSPSSAPDLDPSVLGAKAGLSGTVDSSEGDDLQGTLQDAFAKLTPEQMADIQQRIGEMSDAEKENIIKIVSQMMSPPHDNT
jgi:hypothetical protein